MHLQEIAFHIAPGAHAVLLPGRMAQISRTGCASKHHPIAAATPVSRTQPGRKRVAVHARQLAVEPHFQILRRHRRTLLLRLEPTHRSALAHHVPRPALMGSWAHGF